MRRDHNSAPTQPPVSIPVQREQGGLISRRAFGYGCLGTLLLAGGGAAWGFIEIASLKTSQCGNCDEVGTTTAQAQTATTHESGMPPYDTLEVMYDNIQLPDGSAGRIIAPHGSNAQTGTVGKVEKGKWLVLAVGNGIAQSATMQYGRLDGNITALRDRMQAVNTDSPFIDYEKDGHTGQILTMYFDADMSSVELGATCDQPAFGLKCRPDDKPSYRAYILTDAQYRADGKTLLDNLKADASLGLGDNPWIPDALVASINQS